MNPLSQSSCSTPPTINRDLLELFDVFLLKDLASRLAEALSVKVPSDLCTVNEAQIRATSAVLGLEPAERNQLMELWRAVAMGSAESGNGEARQGAEQAMAIRPPRRSSMRSRSPGRRQGSVRFMEGIELRYGCLEMVR